MKKEIKPVEKRACRETVAKLAEQIWQEHYTPIIGHRQVDYMLESFQSVEAIAEQIEQGYEYYLLFFEEQPGGYLALWPNSQQGGMQLSKIYLVREYRLRGGGRKLLDFTRRLASSRGISRIWLRVNRQNSKAIEWYESQGFKIIGMDKKLIGAGFFMNDYIMELTGFER